MGHLSGVQLIGVGCALSISGNLLISISLNLQKYAHMRLKAQGRPLDEHTQSKLWWLGVFLMGLGEVGNFMAYGFAPASMVAPLGITTLISSAIISAVFLKEKIGYRNIFGIALAVLAAVLIVLSSSSTSESIMTVEQFLKNLHEWQIAVYFTFEVFLLIGLLIAIYAYKVAHVVVYLLVCSTFASFTVISCKAASGMFTLTLSGNSQLKYGTFYLLIVVMAVTAILQVHFLTKAMQTYEANVVVPIYFVLFTLSAIMSGIIFYHELDGMIALNIVFFLLGCVFAFVGVYFISVGRTTSDEDKAEDIAVINNQTPDETIPNSLKIKEVQPPNIMTSDDTQVPLLIEGPVEYGSSNKIHKFLHTLEFLELSGTLNSDISDTDKK